MGVSYSRTRSDDSISTSLRPNLTAYVEGTRFEYRGVERSSGTKTHHYVASNVSAFTADGEKRIFGFDRANLTNASVELYVTDNGVLKRFDFHFVVRTEGGPIEGRMRSVYRDIGTTTVTRPAWLSEAKEGGSEDARTNYSETVTETVRDDSLGATITVTGPRYAIEDVELERQTGGIWDTDGDGFRKAQVSALVSVRTSREITPEKIELSYDDSGMFDENRNVVIFEYDRELQTFVRLSTTVDTSANVARASIDGDGTYLVMNRETWQSLWE
ncbi:hypothetical protein ZOD2009_12527 [Haladaptatus paucihalophilus DX253]|uniref:Uncharacterized protein n=1 Tax=Haladaptatus paucihalophilus DX253 TaxID=797209 RepID=E7QUM1_HALPU|nr:hypothetical protein [Haladaptatus paucihalophilus]EFW91678.1 hypothetical protein ZOD2009_12527 [Haladaptatus paucihalophilus DX253]SHJ97293.1 hypothetical protein SAMN05444342_0123 [Haladaptatus paucihalophilus DX253]